MKIMGMSSSESEKPLRAGQCHDFRPAMSRAGVQCSVRVMCNW